MMKRRTLDVVFVIGGVALAVLLGVLGLVLRSNANFAQSYVKDQLTEQQITFTAAEKLQTDEAWRTALTKSFGGDAAKVTAFIADNELTAEADSRCLQANAGKLMSTGKQAECYANKYIRLHVKDGSIVDGKAYTYATIGAVQGGLRTQVADAKAKNDPNLTALQAKLDAVSAQRETLFKGESLRGLLLTSYGFSIFGEKASLASTVSLLAGLILLLASVAGLIHARVTPKDEVVLAGHGEPAAAGGSRIPT
jgi:hypothetical protein